MAGTDDWQSIARTADPDDLRERILTGFKSGKPFTPYVPTVRVPSGVKWVLDFGCGVGRNFPYLKSIARHVAGFDLPPMIERCRAMATEHVDVLSADWADISARRFDLIYAGLVLQHIEPELAQQYLRDFARMAPQVYLLTRLDSDFGPNVLRMAADTNLFDAGECAEVEHDPGRHQLRRAATRAFADVAASSDQGHYEVLLATRTT